MRSEWSSHWVSSIQARKQRKYRANAPLHTRHKFLAAPLAKALRAELKIRRLAVRKGDEVEVLRGSFRGKKGAVERVNLRTAKLYITGMAVKKAGGAEALVPIDPSNVRITKADLQDKERAAAARRHRGATVPVASKAEHKPEHKAEHSEHKPAQHAHTTEHKAEHKPAEHTHTGHGGAK